jgi:hypothetical protein
MTARPLLPLTYVALVLELGKLMSLSMNQLMSLSMNQPLIFLNLPLSQLLLQQLETLLLMTKRKSAAIALALEEVKDPHLLLAQITNT